MHSKTIISILTILAGFSAGCDSEKRVPAGELSVRVENEQYTMQDVLPDGFSKEKLKQSDEEVFRNWLDREVLYREAKSEGVLSDENFIRTIEKTERELASAFLIKKILNEKKINYKEEDLKYHYERYKENFILNEDVVVVNKITFGDEESAISFRNKAVFIGWDEASNESENETGKENSRYFHKSDMDTPFLFEVLRGLSDDEISIVIDEGKNYYSVYQLKRRFYKGEIPPYELLIPQVTENYLYLQKKILLNEYLQELYSKYEVEIIKGNK